MLCLPCMASTRKPSLGQDDVSVCVQCCSHPKAGACGSQCRTLECEPDSGAAAGGFAWQCRRPLAHSIQIGQAADLRMGQQPGLRLRWRGKHAGLRQLSGQLRLGFRVRRQQRAAASKHGFAMPTPQRCATRSSGPMVQAEPRWLCVSGTLCGTCRHEGQGQGGPSAVPSPGPSQRERAGLCRGVQAAHNEAGHLRLQPVPLQRPPCRARMRAPARRSPPHAFGLHKE